MLTETVVSFLVNFLCVGGVWCGRRDSDPGFLVAICGGFEAWEAPVIDQGILPNVLGDLDHGLAEQCSLSHSEASRSTANSKAHK